MVGSISLAVAGLPALVAAPAWASGPYTDTSTGFSYLLNSAAGTAAVTAYSGSASTVAIPDHVDDPADPTGVDHYTVTEVGGSGAVLSNVSDPSLQSVTVPDTVTSIDSTAFASLSSLQSVTFEGTPTLTSIGTDAFEYDPALTGISIPASLTTLGDDVFSEDTSLSSVAFAAGTTLSEIPTYAFSDDTVLATVEIPASVTSIDKAAFQDDAALSSATFAAGSGLTTIGQDAFGGDTALTAVTIPATVTDIDVAAFDGDTALSSITFPATSALATIGPAAFDGDTALTAVTIPATVTTLGVYAFEFDSSLSTLTFADGSALTSIPDYTFSEDTALTSVTIPAAVTSLGPEAFDGDTSLSSVGFADGSALTSIGANAFYGDLALTSITIPAGVTTVDDSAFEATSVATVTFPASVTSVGFAAFAFDTALTSATFEGPAPTTFTAAGSTGSLGPDTTTVSFRAQYAVPGGFTTPTWEGYPTAEITPVLTGVTPAEGSAGTRVTITGSDLTGASAVLFGSTPASEVTVVSDTEVTATMPLVTAGATTVSVQSPDGTSNAEPFTADLAAQSIAFTAPSAGAAGMTTTLNASSSSGLPVSFSSTTPTVCTVSSGTVSYLAAGDCILDADQGGDGEYAAASRVEQTIAVSAAEAPSGPSQGGTSQGGSSSQGGTSSQGGAPAQVRNPSIIAQLTSAHAKRNGWYRSPVTVTFRCTAGSASVSCPKPVTLSKSGRDLTVTRTVTAADGGSASVTVTGIRLDRVKPTVTLKGITHGETYLARTPSPHCVASDALSGIARCTVRQTHSGTETTYVARAVDRAGNARTVRTSAFVSPIALRGIAAHNGVFTVTRGHSYLLVVLSKQRPAFIHAAPVPWQPAGFGGYLVRAGSVDGIPRWTMRITMDISARYPVWRIGIREGQALRYLTVAES